MGARVSPILNTPPASLPIPSLRSFLMKVPRKQIQRRFLDDGFVPRISFESSCAGDGFPGGPLGLLVPSLGSCLPSPITGLHSPEVTACFLPRTGGGGLA